MTGGLFSNAKMTLVFAGGVIGAAVLFAGVLAPTIVERAGEQTQAPDEPREESAHDSAEPTDDDADGAASFGDFAGFADDSELIDEATGFDPSPPGEESLVLVPGGASSPTDNARASFRDDSGQSAGNGDGDGETRPALRSPGMKPLPPARASRLQRRPENLSVAQMKAQLAKPPRVGNSGE